MDPWLHLSSLSLVRASGQYSTESPAAADRQFVSHLHSCPRPDEERAANGGNGPCCPKGDLCVDVGPLRTGAHEKAGKRPSQAISLKVSCQHPGLVHRLRPWSSPKDQARQKSEPGRFLPFRR